MSEPVITVLTKSEYHEKQRQKALQLAPPNEITEDHFRALLMPVPISVLRLAAIRWTAPRGRSQAAVIDGIVAGLQNPHTNKQGDTYRVALGHIHATQAAKKRD